MKKCREAVVSISGRELDVTVSWQSRQQERPASTEVGERGGQTRIMSFTSIPLATWVTQVADTWSGLGPEEAEDRAQPPAPREIPRVCAEGPGA